MDFESNGTGVIQPIDPIKREWYIEPIDDIIDGARVGQ